MAHHRKKVAGHKLDYDCKKRHGEQGTGMVESEKKFAESYKVSKTIIIFHHGSEVIIHFYCLCSGCPAEYE